MSGAWHGSAYSGGAPRTHDKLYYDIDNKQTLYCILGVVILVYFLCLERSAKMQYNVNM